MKKSILKYFIVLIVAVNIVACNKNESQNIYPTFSEYLQSRPDLSFFNQAVDKAKLQSFKEGQGPFTWFIPTNDAFISAGISQDSLNRMSSGNLSYLLLYNLINPTSIPLVPIYTKDMIAQNSFAKNTQLGQNLYLGSYADSFYVNGNSITTKDVRVANGIVHIMKKFNTPPLLTGNIQVVLNSTGNHSIFISALTKANRWASLGTSSVFTILAPTDAAMNDAGYNSSYITSSPVSRIDSLVRYHLFGNSRLFSNDFGNKVSPGTHLGTSKTISSSNFGRTFKGLTNINTVNAITSNILATNGVVHILDGVLKY